MESRLDEIEDWRQLGRASRYRVKELAGRLDVSPRRLQQYFFAQIHYSPGTWLGHLMASDAADLLIAGRPTREVAAILGHSSAASFARAFRSVVGIWPAKFLHASRAKTDFEIASISFAARFQISHFGMRNLIELEPSLNFNWQHSKRRARLSLDLAGQRRQYGDAFAKDHRGTGRPEIDREVRAVD